jgi:hypothetical protein
MLFLSILFWAFFAAYVVHILDETLINGGFVQWVVNNFWPAYRLSMFFWFNTMLLALIAAGNVIFDFFGGHWVIIPLVWVAGFATHAITLHLYWSIRRNSYVPGLLTSSLYLVIFYLSIKFGLGRGLISGRDFTVGTVVGVFTVGAFLTIGPTVLFPRIMRDRKNRQ